MIKIVQKHIKVKATSLKYLYEIAAIPIETREKFLQKLLKRKNASEQKNVKLLKTIYKCINEGEMLNWDEDIICNELNISKGMLYCHKSYLLRDLRVFYFNWKEIEKKEFNDKTKYKDETSLELAKAERMHHIGMAKEAQLVFFKIEKLIRKKIKKTKDDYITLFKATKYSCNYYHKCRNRKKFNLYYKKIIKLSNHIIKTIPDFKSHILMHLYILMAAKAKFHGDKTTTITEAIRFYKLALTESQKTKDYKQEAVILLNLSNIYRTIGNLKEDKRYTSLALSLGKRTKAMDVYYAFKSSMDFLYYISGKINQSEALIRITDTLNNLHYSDKSAFLKQRTLFHILQLASFSANNKTFSNVIYEYTARELIYNGLNTSLRSLYIMKWTNYLKNLIQTSLINNSASIKKHLLIKEANIKYIKKLDNSIMELSLYGNKIRDIVFRREFYLAMLLTDFWKGKNCSIEYSSHIYRQIEWINRTRPELANSNKESADNAFLGINIMAESQYLVSDKLLEKYEQKFKNYADNILLLYKKNNDRGLDAYYMLSFTAEQSQCEELKLIARKTFFQLEKINPIYIKTQIEESERKKEEEALNISGSLRTKAA